MRRIVWAKKMDASNFNPMARLLFPTIGGNGENGNIRNNLGVGNYPLTITDGDGCIYDTTIVVIAPQAIELEVDLRPPKCSGGSDGLISLNVDGNLTAPISYRWDDGNTQKNRSGLMDGSYVLTITDGNACQLIADTLVLESPEELTASVLEVGPIKCKERPLVLLNCKPAGGCPLMNSTGIIWSKTRKAFLIFRQDPTVFRFRTRMIVPSKRR
jgi:hypothetical protein